MSELKHVRSVLAVKDLAASVAFYRDKLGFSIDFEVDGWCEDARAGGRRQVYGNHSES